MRSPHPAGTTAMTSTAANEADAATARAEALERLKAYEPGPTSDAPATPPVKPAAASTTIPALPAATSGGTAATTTAAATSPTAAHSSNTSHKKSVPELLQDRLHWLNEHEAATLALQKATHPDPSPEQQAAEAKAEIARLQSVLSLAAQSPEKLVPPLFQARRGEVSSALASEMKDAIETERNELKECKTKLDILRTEIAKWNGTMNMRRKERDNHFQRVSALTAKAGEFRSAVTDAQTAAERRLAQERLTNFEWEVRVETLRLRVIEAQLALETKLADVRDLRAEVCRASIQVAMKTLAPMETRYQIVAEDQERNLARAKVTEEDKARSTDDPLERFRARRSAEILALEALVVKSEQTLVMPPPPSYDEQKTLADRADLDFANIKELLDDGKVSRLDAIRLNNEFRRIGPERDRLLKNEMAAVESQLQFYENTLTSVELELLQDSLHDRLEHDLLRERLSPARWTIGETMIDELEKKHRSLLLRRQRALEKLSESASHTLVQITRRLGILEQEYGFIRTNIFWVRDQEPIGLLTLTQGAREVNVLVKGLLRLTQETVTPHLWGQPSGEFAVAAVGVVLSPIGLVWLRRMLGKRLKRDPAPTSA